MHPPRSLIAEELSACIRCNECLVACPALGEPLSVETLNNETLAGTLSPQVARFARTCYQCGACVPVCPVGLHRDSMMLWLKMRLLGGPHRLASSSAGRGSGALMPGVAVAVQDGVPGAREGGHSPGAPRQVPLAGVGVPSRAHGTRRR